MIDYFFNKLDYISVVYVNLILILFLCGASEFVLKMGVGGVLILVSLHIVSLIRKFESIS